jgi:hypothetical protein
MIVGPDNKVASCRAQEMAERVALGKWAADKFNELLAHPKFDLIRYDEAGWIRLEAQNGTSPAFAADAFTEFGDLLKRPNPPRFIAGLFGSVWVDLALAGTRVRLALDPTRDAKRKPWGLLLIPLNG